MSIRSADVGRITLHDSLNRAVPDYASPEAIAAQTAAYLARGGCIQQLPAGITAYEYSTRPNQQRASAGGKKGGAAKKGLPNRGKKPEIRTEDWS